MNYYLVKLLTNTAGQDGSSIEGVYDNKESALVAYHNLCAPLHNAADVLHVVVQIVNEYGNVEIMEIIDHTPVPEPEEEEVTE